MENKEKVLETLKGAEDALRIVDIVEKTGLEKNDVEKVIKVLKKEDLISSPKRCFYQLKA